MTYIPSFIELEIHSTLHPKLNKYLHRLKKEAPQSAKWHPEGNTFIHTKIVYNRAAQSGNINLALAAFFHDLGKADTTKRNNKGNWAAHGHEAVSANLVKEFGDWIEYWGGNVETVHWIVLNHMRMKQFNQMRASKRKLLTDHDDFTLLRYFSDKCDSIAKTSDVWVATDIFHTTLFLFKKIFLSRYGIFKKFV